MSVHPWNVILERAMSESGMFEARLCILGEVILDRAMGGAGVF